MNATRKRKLDSDTPEEPDKRLRMTTQAGPSASGIVPPQPVADASEITSSKPLDSSSEPKRKGKGKGKKKENSNLVEKECRAPPRRRINKLNAPRPFPTVPTSVNATGPRSSHREGTNMICLTRKTGLGAYMRRCKNVIVQDGYKTLHLSAMGAAIPLLLQLVCALPPILPFPQDEIRWDVETGTVEVQDEVIPDDEDEDLSYQTRCKSTLSVIFKIGDGEFEGNRGAIRKYSAGKSVGKTHHPPRNKGKGNQENKGKGKEDTTEVVYEEPEQVFMDML